MPKALTRLTLALSAALLCARAADAQTTLEWIVLAPAREGFTARVPQQPVATPQRVRAKGLNASGLRYAAGEGRADGVAVRRPRIQLQHLLSEAEGGLWLSD